MVKYLGEMEEEDLIMFVVEHLKDHKSPQKLIEGLEPVRVHLDLCYMFTFSLVYFAQVLEEEAVEFTVSLWRQIIFESMAYNEGLVTEKMLVD
jgi:RNA-binding protein 25